MEIVNGYGGALTLTPVDFNNYSTDLSMHNSTLNEIYFFGSKNLIDNDGLYNANTLEDVKILHNDTFIGSIYGFGLDFIYDNTKKQRIIKQNPIDAYRFNTVNAGTIEWCAIKIGTYDGGDLLIFTDEIGTFDIPSSINLDSLTAVLGVENIVTSIKIDVRDKCDNEV